MMVQKQATLHEKTVQKIASKGLKPLRRTRTPEKRPRASKVVVRAWYDGVDPRVVAAIKAMGVDHRRLQKISSTEVIVHNNPNWNETLS